MTDPLYEYVKGKGWIINPPVRSRNRKYYYVELRKPNPGECCCYSNNEKYASLQAWKEWIAGNMPYSYETLKSELKDERLFWCTFVEVT